jgi:hypothetical protein
MRRRVWPLAAAALATGAVILAVVLAVASGLARMGAHPTAAPTTTDPAAATAQARRKLIASVAGTWDRQGGDCSAPIKISAGADSVGETTITVSGSGGFNSVSQVITADNGRIVSRDVEPKGVAAGETWEYQPNDALMTVIDGKGTPTTLKRCAPA